jgi:hypothetical protein
VAIASRFNLLAGTSIERISSLVTLVKISNYLSGLTLEISNASSSVMYYFSLARSMMSSFAIILFFR